MTLPRPDVDPDGLLEYSVVFTDLALNHMSARFVEVMQQLDKVLTSTYAADAVAVVPGGGTFGMESVARQLVTGRRALVVRNGFFSYRWSQILQMGGITDDVTVLTARPTQEARPSPWAPPPVEEVVAAIAEQRPRLVLAAHVETASGILLPDDYVRQVAQATREAGGLFVLDCIASGALWVDMKDLSVDVLISAPQKGWSGTPGTAYVMVDERAREAIEATTSSSFVTDLQKWLTITEGYAEGRHAYHATVPTDTIVHNTELMLEAQRRGLPALREAQVELGTKVRALLAERAASPPWRPRGMRLPAWSSSTPTTLGCGRARSSSRSACRRPRACRSCAASPRTSPPSAWGSSGWTSGPTSTAPSSGWRRGWTGSPGSSARPQVADATSSCGSGSGSRSESGRTSSSASGSSSASSGKSRSRSAATTRRARSASLTS